MPPVEKKDVGAPLNGEVRKRQHSNEREYLIEIGNYIRTMREKTGVSQMDLSGRCHIHLNTLFKIEKGKTGCSIDILKRIYDALGVDLVKKITRN